MKEAGVINYIVTKEETVKLRNLDAKKTEALLGALHLEAVKAETSGLGGAGIRANKKSR